MEEKDQHPLNSNLPPNIHPINTYPKEKPEHIYISTLNVRSLSSPERLLELEKALEDIKWDIIGISEMRRMGESIEEYENFILYYKGETPGLYGVGFIVKKYLARKIEEIVGISERVAILNIKLPTSQNEETWSIIQAYAPTEANKKEELSKIDDFFEILQSADQYIGKNIIVMGDFNGKIGLRKPGEEHIIGSSSYGVRSRNGNKLVNYALQNKLTILNSCYTRKPNKKWTWISPNGNYRNEIDFILSNKPKCFSNTHVLNQFNFNTDHRMVRASLKTLPVKKSRRNYKNNKLIPMPENFENLQNNLSSALSEQDTMQGTVKEKYYTLINNLIREVSKCKSKNKTLSEESEKLLEQRKQLLLSKKDKDTKNKITELSKKIRDQIRKDISQKRNKTIQEHISKTGGVKKAYKKLMNKKDWMIHLKGKNSILTRNREQIIKVAAEFYRNLYKSSRKNQNTAENENTICNEEPLPEILLSETIAAIKSQKNDKAPGPDQISNEMLKAAMPVIAPRLTEIFNEIIETEIIPEDWTKSTITLIYKKGDKSDIGNYRPISIMSNIYKVFSKILLSRISKILDENQPKEQAGFRSKFSTIDHIYTVKQILEKFKEYNCVYYLGFIDYNKAFDSLEHDAIWRSLRLQGVHGKIINILKSIYSKTYACVKLDKKSEEFPVERGVRQGDPISPKLFSAVLEMVFRNLEWENEGLNINGEKLNHLRFADDLVLFSDCPKKLENMIQRLSDESAKVGLTMNTNKTKIMTNSEEKEIKVNETIIEYVNEYVYLGHLLATKDCMTREIDRRVTNTWKKYWSLSEIMKNKHVPIKDKRKVFDTCILPCLTYASQTWALTGKNLATLRTCQNSMERSVVGVKLRDRVKLQNIREITKFKKVDKLIKQQKWRWAGHMVRENIEKWSKKVTEWYPRDKKRNRGRQSKRWDDDISGLVGKMWTRLARDREVWKSLEEAYVDGHADHIPLE